MMPKNKFSKYLGYAIGEIILVVIGILFAIQLNNINEDRKEREKELSFLSKIKSDIALDIIDLSRVDSIVAIYESSSERALQMLHEAKTVEDILIIDSLFKFNWNNLKVNRKTYNEMLNTSGIYILNNKKLRNKLSDYYTLIETNQEFIKEINDDSQEMNRNSNLDAYYFLVHEHGKPWFDIEKVDTRWIGDLNAPTTLALHRFYKHAQENINRFRLDTHKVIMTFSNELTNDIEKELQNRNYTP